MKFKKNRNGVSLVIFVLGITAIFAFASFVIDFGIVLNTRNELQKALESAVLVGATSLEPKKNIANGQISIDTTNIENIVKSTFADIQNGNGVIKSAVTPQVTIKAFSKAIKVSTSIDCETFFLKLLGIKTIKIEAQAAAMSAPFYMSKYFPAGLSPGSILKESTGDTNIKVPVGDNPNRNSSYENLYNAPDSMALSLGAGGYITLRLPVPIVNKDGADLYLKEMGNVEGYFIFAGIDNDPNNPYVNESMPGAGIKWVNISCTGTPVGVSTSGKIGSYLTKVMINGVNYKEPKFYGSGYFDLGATCTNGANALYSNNVQTVTYLKIIDDNTEDGFLSGYLQEPVLTPGEHSSVSPGVDIDAIGVLHHSRLISAKDFDTDNDMDNLIDSLELILGSSTTNSDTDGDGVNDNFEYVGWSGSAASPQSIIDHSSSTVYFTNPVEDDSTKGLEMQIKL